MDDKKEALYLGCIITLIEIIQDNADLSDPVIKHIVAKALDLIGENPTWGDE